MNTKLCDGCRLDCLIDLEHPFITQDRNTFETARNFNKFKKYYNKSCPCINCLVRPTCSEPCNKHHQHRVWVWNNLEESTKMGPVGVFF